LVAGLLVAALVCAPAWSDDAVVEDPTGDGNGSVDLLSAGHGQGRVDAGPFSGTGPAGAVLSHDVESSDDWSFDGDLLELRMTSREWRRPRRLFVRANPDGSLTGLVFAGDLFPGYANVYETDSSTLRVEFPESVLGDEVRSYRWRVFGMGTDGDDTLPPDRLPDAGSVRHGGLGRYGP
jgi:hypothetical protein